MDSLTRQVYLIEQQQRDHLSGHWGKWIPRDQYYTNYRQAKRDWEILRWGHADGMPADDMHYRIVTFKRGRVYHDQVKAE